jgi:hypothetical protein
MATVKPHPNCKMATRSKKRKVIEPTTSKRSKQVVEEIPQTRLLLASEIQSNIEETPLEPMIIEGLEEHQEEVSVLKWVPVTDGVIPDDAVEGGWSDFDKMPLYIGRVKEGDSFLIGYVCRNTMKCSYNVLSGHVNRMNESNIFEVLVNSGRAAVLNWVFARGTEIPSNAFAGGYISPGKPIYIGRHTIGNKHLFVGYVNPSIGVLHIHKCSDIYKEFYILTIDKGNVEIIEEIDHCTLDDIDYKLDEAKTSKVPVTFDEVELQNHSSIEQQLKAHSFFENEDSYCWNIDSDTDIMTKIDGKIPVICKAKGDLKMDYISYPQQQQQFINYNVGNPQMFGNFRNGLLLVKFEMNNNPHLLGGLGHHTFQQTNLPNITVKMKLGERLVSCTKHDEDVECKVPPKTGVKVKVQAISDVLEVPFTAHLRKVYKNGMTAEEDVRGTFTSETTAHITSTVDDEKAIES